MERHRLRTGSYPAFMAREFIGHVIGLWRGFAVMVGLEPEKANELVGVLTSPRLEKATKMFYEISKQMKSNGILYLGSSLKKSGSSDIRDIGRSSGLGVADE